MNFDFSAHTTIKRHMNSLAPFNGEIFIRRDAKLLIANGWSLQVAHGAADSFLLRAVIRILGREFSRVKVSDPIQGGVWAGARSQRFAPGPNDRAGRS